MRSLRVFCIFILLSVTLHAVPKFFFVNTYGRPSGAQYDGQRNLIYVSSPRTSQVLAVAADTGEITKSVYVPNAAGLDITLDGKRLVVGGTAVGGWYGSGFLTFIELDTFTIGERLAISNPIRLASGTGTGVNSPYINRVVALYNGNVLFTVSPPDSTETWVGEYKQAEHSFKLIAWSSGALIPSDDRKRVLLPDMGPGVGLQVFDADADAVIAANPDLDSVGAKFSHDGKLIGICVDQSHTLILDATSLQPIRMIGTPTAGTVVAFSVDNSKIYIQKFAGSGLYVFDVNTGVMVGAVSTPGDDHEFIYPLGMDSRGMLYSSLDRGLAVTDLRLIGLFDPQSSNTGTSFPYVADPSGGPLSGGTAVTLRHHYVARPTVYFGDKIATISSSDSNGIHVTAPPGDRPGPVDITVRYDNGFVEYIEQGFSYGPAIEYLDHTGGSSSGGDSLTLFALGLRSFSTTDVQVKIGGAFATIESVKMIGISPMKSPTYRINLKTPSGTVGAADVVLTTVDGSSTLKEGFNYVNIRTLGGASTISHMVYDDTREYLFRCNYGSNRVEVVDTRTGQFINQYSTHPGPVALALSPDHSILYVTGNAGIIDVINLNTGALGFISVTLPSGMTMTRIGATIKGTLFVGIYNPSVIYDSRLIEVNPTDGSFTTRLQGFNGNYLEIGLSRDGSRGFISSDLEAGASGNTLYYWDSFTDSFRKQFVPGWSDYGVDDSASILAGSGLVYDPAFNIHAVLQGFDFDYLVDRFLWGEKLDDAGSLVIRPTVDSIVVFDVHHSSRAARLLLPSQTVGTLDAMAVDSIHGVAYISSSAGLLAVSLPNLLSIGRIEPSQGLTSGGQTVVIRGFGFRQNATVTIGDQPAAAVFVNSTTLRVTTPALPLGEAAVQVTNDDGRSYMLPVEYSAVGTQPIVTATSPSQLRVSSFGAYTGVGVIGMSFAPGAVALWNGSPRPTYFVDDTELRIDLDGLDTRAIGAARLAVRNPDGGISNEITVLIKDYPQISFPGSFSFGTQVVNSSSAVQTGTVTNLGTDSVTLTFSVASPFTLSTECPAVIAAGASCSLSVGFSPTAPGIYSSAIVVGGETAATINLHGTAGLATATISVSPTELNFPATDSHTQSQANVVVTNIGMPEVLINNVTSDSSDFSATSYVFGALPTGQWGSISVTFRPQVRGTRTGNLVIESSAGTIRVPMTGTGSEQLGFDTTALLIQAVKGQSAASKVVATFANTGGTGVTLGGVSLIPTSTKLAFTQSNNCPAVLNGGSSCSVTVSYVPSGEASDTANLMIAAGFTSYTVALTGAVTDFAVSGSAPSATITAGQVATFPVAVDTTGGYRGTLNFSCSGAPLNATCTVNPSTITAGAANATVTVSVGTMPRLSTSLHWPFGAGLTFAIISIGCVVVTKSNRSKSFLIVLALGIAALNGCGGGGGSGTTPPPPPVTTGTPAGTYTLTVTATTPDGAARSSSLTLKVN